MLFYVFYFEFFVFNCLLPFPSLKLAIAQNQIIGYNNSILLHQRNHSFQGQSKSTPFRAIVSHHNHFHEFNSSNGNLSVPTTVVNRGVPSSNMNYYINTKNNNSRNSNSSSSSSSSNSSKPLVIQLPGADKSQEKHCAPDAGEQCEQVSLGRLQHLGGGRWLHCSGCDAQ